MDVFEQLRQKFDGADSFVSGGHAVRGGGATRNAERFANTPEWANDDARVRELLMKVFPKLQTSESQRKRALSWLTVIYLYHRRGFPQMRIAMELGWSETKVNSVIRNIKRANEGRQANGKLRTGKRGRPKKNSALLDASSGNPAF